MTIFTNDSGQEELFMSDGMTDASRGDSWQDLHEYTEAFITFFGGGKGSFEDLGNLARRTQAFQKHPGLYDKLAADDEHAWGQALSDFYRVWRGDQGIFKRVHEISALFDHMLIDAWCVGSGVQMGIIDHVVDAWLRAHDENSTLGDRFLIVLPTIKPEMIIKLERRS